MAVTPRAFFQPASTTGLPAFTPGSTFQIVIGSRPFNEARESYPTQAITKKKGRSSKNPQATPTQSIAKKKGRPFKTPEGVAAAAARTSSNGQFPKRRGRPLKDLEAFEKVIPVTLPEPKFVPFVCEWKDCPAELHNLDTLRAHLVTVHLKKQHNGSPLVCLWRKCHQETKVVNVQTGLPKIIDKGFDFNTKDEWMNHIQEAHLKKVAWYQGDGPKTELCKCEFHCIILTAFTEKCQHSPNTHDRRFPIHGFMVDPKDRQHLRLGISHLRKAVRRLTTLRDFVRREMAYTLFSCQLRTPMRT